MSAPLPPEGIPEPPALFDGGGADNLAGRRPPSLLTNSFARLVADLWTLAMSLVAATVTARALGTAGKGFYSTLTLLVGAFMYLFSAGLPEASVVLAGRGRFGPREAASAMAAATIPLSVVGAAVFMLVGEWALGPSTSDDRWAVVLGGVQVGVMILHMTVVWVLVAEERIATVAGLAILLATATTLGLWALVAGADLGRPGAILGGVVGSAVTLAGGVLVLLRIRRLPTPRLVAGFLRPALRLGAQLQISNLLVTLTARLDLLLVYRMRSPAAAGAYSVALTIGALVGAIPVAVAYASFPRLAKLGEAEARALTAQLFRMGVAAGILTGAGMALVTPTVVPFVFGAAFDGAIAPTLLLIPAGVLWSAQWLLARALAARGQPRALMTSFAVSFVMMVLLDLVLVPALGAVGAGLGTLAASTAGVLVAAFFYRDSEWDWRSFRPRFRDLLVFFTLVRRVVGARAGQPAA